MKTVREKWVSPLPYCFYQSFYSVYYQLISYIVIFQTFYCSFLQYFNYDLQGKLVVRVPRYRSHHRYGDTGYSWCSNLSFDLEGNKNQVRDVLFYSPPFKLLCMHIYIQMREKAATCPCFRVVQALVTLPHLFWYIIFQERSYR
jgi:hypothetical protein